MVPCSASSISFTLNTTSLYANGYNDKIDERTRAAGSGCARAAARTLSAVAAALMFSAAGAVEAPPPSETLSNIPQTLSGKCASVGEDCNKRRVQRPKSRKAESCTIKCVATCIRGGDGSPGEGPLNVRRPLVVFKQGFRSRQYCLVECSDICNLIGDGDDGP
ncbi:uncharacterized protein LOC131157790 [Malania oleifera]|uniref:uncharacterized protein LOC131157790 n=1 Tax=Malania oleifera TaxID=397392 RepID=UPI0025AE15F5|nr:uncharacterized protein LOC131157790 [Malania oleifera]